MTPQPGEALREAAQEVVRRAEFDDNFEGEYVDFLVPADALEALRAALGAAPVAGEGLLARWPEADLFAALDAEGWFRGISTAEATRATQEALQPPRPARGRGAGRGERHDSRSAGKVPCRPRRQPARSGGEDMSADERALRTDAGRRMLNWWTNGDTEALLIEADFRAAIRAIEDEAAARGLISSEVVGSPDYMCPNCVTPWKCNGPHIPESVPGLPSSFPVDPKP